MDALIKQLSPRYPTLEIAFLRYAFGMVGAVAYALWMRPGWPTRDAATYNGLRALLIVVTATSFFFALGRLPLADAIAMSFISPGADRAARGHAAWRKARLAHRAGARGRLPRHAADRRRQARGFGHGRRRC